MTENKTERVAYVEQEGPSPSLSLAWARVPYFMASVVGADYIIP